MKNRASKWMILLFFMQTSLSCRWVALKNEWKRGERRKWNFYDLLFIMRRMSFSHHDITSLYGNLWSVKLSDESQVKLICNVNEPGMSEWHEKFPGKLWKRRYQIDLKLNQILRGLKSDRFYDILVWSFSVYVWIFVIIFLPPYSPSQNNPVVLKLNDNFNIFQF